MEIYVVDYFTVKEEDLEHFKFTEWIKLDMPDVKIVGVYDNLEMAKQEAKQEVKDFATNFYGVYVKNCEVSKINQKKISDEQYISYIVADRYDFKEYFVSRVRKQTLNQNFQKKD